MHVATPSLSPLRESSSSYLVAVDSQVACSVLERLKATQGEATLVVICQAVTFTCLVLSLLSKHGVGNCTLFIAYLKAQGIQLQPHVTFVVHLRLLLGRI